MTELQSIYGSICLTDVPKEVFKKGKDGKTYLNLSIFPMKKEDPYGNQFTVSCAPKQEERVDGVNYLVGKFKLSKPKVETPTETPMPTDNVDFNPPQSDDLPF